MRILLVSWEYPPVVVGGLGRHVHHLSMGLAQAGHDVIVLSRQPTHTDACSHPLTDHYVDGVRVIAVPEDPHEFSFTNDMMAWTLAMGHAMIRAGLSLSRDGQHDLWRPDLVHAHDWLVAYPSIALAQFYDVPLVSTIHATEAGRHSGWINSQVSRQVHASESWLVRSSDWVITCSASMRNEVDDLFGLVESSTSVIPNGIDVDQWPFSLRQNHEGPAELLYVGRLEYEKGVHDLIYALPHIQASYPGTRLTIAGDGTQYDWLVECAREKQVSHSTYFVGRLDHDALLEALHRVDVAVLPSHYEPFGLAALEAAAAGTPLATSNVGGLGEAVIHGHTGISFPPGDVKALAHGVCSVLSDPVQAQQRAIAARERLTSDFDWATVTEQTVDVYRQARRGNHSPLGRQPIPTRALPNRHIPMS